MRLLRRLRDVFWFPYGLAFRHRTFLSHFPVVGTTTRILYVGLPLLLVAWRLGVDFSKIPHWVEMVGAGAAIGVAAAETAHALADSWHRPRLRRRSR